MATAGRALIKQQQQAALDKIQKNKEAALKQLDIQYASVDKAKQSFGYIGIISLSLLFGVIILNDLFKMCKYIHNEINDNWYEENIEFKNDENGKFNDDIVLDMDQELEEKLENIYFSLVKAHAKK